MPHSKSLGSPIKTSKFLRTLICFALAAGVMIGPRTVVGQTEFDEHGRWVNGTGEPIFIPEGSFGLDQARGFRDRWRLLSLQALQPGAGEWDGFYSRGDLHEAWIRISEKGGFAYASVFTCAMQLTRIDYGSAVFSPTIVTLKSEYVAPASAGTHGAHGSHGGEKPHPRYVPIRWGSWRFLVEDDRLKEFFAYASVGDTEGYFFLSTGGPDDLPEGNPIAPKGYERFVRNPISAEIVSAGKSLITKSEYSSSGFARVTPVKVNVGRAHGVKKGNSLYLIGSHYQDAVEITRVFRGYALGKVVRNTDDNEAEKLWDHESKSFVDYPVVIKPGVPLTSQILLAKQL